jgi:hypothetical protein
MQAVEGAGGERRAGARFWLAVAAVLALHGALVQHFVPLGVVFGPEPIQGDDYDLHIGQVFRVVEGLARWGRSWVYDVELVAGHPEGTITDAGSKGWELFTYALYALGVPKPVAFNLFVLLACWGAPFALYAAGRLFGLCPWTSLVAGAMASTLWFFDSFAHWLWWVGMVSYASTAYLGLLPLALFYRYLESGRARYALACAPLLGVVHLIHPYSFFALAPPMAALYARSFRGLPRAGHAAVAGIALGTLAINAFWLRSAAQHWHYILDSAFYGQASPSYLIADFLNVLVTPTDTGVIGNRTAFRFLYLALGVVGLLGWRRSGERRFLPFAVGLGVLFGLSYFAVLLPGAAQIQPYRHALPLAMWACLPAASFVVWLAREHVLARAARPVQMLLGVGALVIAQHLATQALYFLPALVPDPAPFPDGSKSPISQYGHLALGSSPAHVHYGLPHAAWLEPGFAEVIEWVEAHVPQGGRVLIDNTVLGERLAWRTHVEVMGGFLERNVAHAYANYFRRYGNRDLGPVELARYLRTFNIGFVILQGERPELERHTGLLELLETAGGFRIYRTRLPVSPFVQGRGRVRASTNRIEVQDSESSETLVLSYHFHELLRCEPDCRVERQPIDLDRVGLIRIPAPHPRDLVIVNRYR